MTIQEEIKLLHAEKEQTLNYLKQKSTAVMHKAAQELFDEHPGLKQFAWWQGEPWRDGEETEFEVPTRNHIEVNNHHVDDYYVYDPDGCELEDPSEEFEALVEAVRGFMAQFKIDDYLMMFGNGAAVSITRDGIEVEEWQDG
jgi:hypothetical protein